MNNIDVFIGEQVMNIGPSHPFQERLGADGLRKQMIEIQDQIESIPAIIDAVIAEQYGEIEDIIESQDLDEEEKRRRVRDKLRVGLEMGLPTIMYERSAEDR